MLFIQDAYAQTAAAPQQGSGMVSLIMMIVIFAVMWFLMIAPQRKRMKQHQEMVNNLKRGDEVITQGGLMGRITALHDHAVEVELAQGIVVAVQRGYVAQVLPKGSVPRVSAQGGKRSKKNIPEFEELTEDNAEPYQAKDSQAKDTEAKDTQVRDDANADGSALADEQDGKK